MSLPTWVFRTIIILLSDYYILPYFDDLPDLMLKLWLFDFNELIWVHIGFS